MTSLPGAFVGGVVVGIDRGDGPDATSPRTPARRPARSSLFVVLLAVLLVRPAGLLGKET